MFLSCFCIYFIWLVLPVHLTFYMHSEMRTDFSSSFQNFKLNNCFIFVFLTIFYDLFCIFILYKME